MPRDGSNVWAPPAGTTATASTTIESAKYNALVADLTSLANEARPVSVGGTGASTVGGAQTALKIPAYDGTATVSGQWTFTASQKFNDSVKALFGTGGDLEIYHDGATSFIADVGTGNLTISTNGTAINLLGASSEILLRVISGGEAELRHNGSIKAVTTSTGFTVTGLVSGTTIGGAMVSTDISADTGSAVKVPNVAAVEAAIAAVDVQPTLATMQSGSGSALTFTGIPAGTKEITVMFNGLSLTGTDHFLVQIGDAGGFEVSGYTSASEGGGASVSSTAGFIVVGNSAAAGLYGQVTLSLMDSATFLWASQHGIARGTSSMNGGGAKALSAELTQVRIVPSASNTFDAGSVNVSYR